MKYLTRTVLLGGACVLSVGAVYHGSKPSPVLSDLWIAASATDNALENQSTLVMQNIPLKDCEMVANATRENPPLWAWCEKIRP